MPEVRRTRTGGLAMPADPTAAVLLVSTPGDLVAALDDAVALLSRRRGRVGDDLALGLLGAWIHDHPGRDLVDGFAAGASGDVAGVRLVETAGISGRWLVGCFAVEGLASPTPAAVRSALVGLLSPLLAAADGRQVRFFPVFPADCPPEQRRAELERLRRGHPGIVGDPVGPGEP